MKLTETAPAEGRKRRTACLYAFLQPGHRLIEQGGYDAEDDDAHDHHIHFEEAWVRNDTIAYRFPPLDNRFHKGNFL